MEKRRMAPDFLFPLPLSAPTTLMAAVVGAVGRQVTSRRNIPRRNISRRNIPPSTHLTWQMMTGSAYFDQRSTSTEEEGERLKRKRKRNVRNVRTVRNVRNVGNVRKRRKRRRKEKRKKSGNRL